MGCVCGVWHVYVCDVCGWEVCVAYAVHVWCVWCVARVCVWYVWWEVCVCMVCVLCVVSVFL